MKKIEISTNIFTFLWNFIKKYKISLFMAIFVSSITVITSTIGGQYILKITIDKLTNKELNFKSGILYCLVFSFLNFSSLLLDIIIKKLLFNANIKVQNDIQNSIFQYIEKHSMEFFNNNFAGTIGGKIRSLCIGVEKIVFSIVDTFCFFSAFAVIMCIFAKYSLLLFTIMVILVIIYGFIFIFITNKLKKETGEEIKIVNNYTGKLVDCLNSISIIKSFSKENYEKGEIKKYGIEFLKKKSDVVKIRCLINLFNFISYFLILSTISIITLHLYFKNKITLGTLTLFIVTSLKIFSWLKFIFENLITGFEQYGNMQQALDTLTQPHKIINLSKNKLQISDGEINIKNIYFKYKENLNCVFNNFSLNIPSNQKLGLVGYSGAGKTTLINLLLRFYDVNDGGIYIDNQNIKTDITQESLRNNISYIPQDPILFHRSIRDNIVYGKLNATEEEIIEATKKANCFEFINNLENKFDTLVGERGIKLSGGQRQRIAIARAILKNSKILILDEATSALDSITEKEIQIALNNLM